MLIKSGRRLVFHCWFCRARGTDYDTYVVDRRASRRRPAVGIAAQFGCGNSLVASHCTSNVYSCNTVYTHHKYCGTLALKVLKLDF